MFLFAAMLSTGCSNDSDEMVSENEQEGQTEDSRTVNLTKVQQDAINDNNDFAFNLFRKVSSTGEQTGKSFVVSPLSVTYALGMLNMGATGQTSSEITSALGFDGEGSQMVNEFCQLLIEKVPKMDETVALQLANMVVVDKSVQLQSQYSEALGHYYSAEALTLDMSSGEAVYFVNSWCNTKTKGMIPHMVDDLSGSRLALLNAVYFKAPWLGQFDPKGTSKKVFTKEDGTQIAIPMMHRDDLAFYRQCNGYSVLGLPYGSGRNWTLYVILPDEGNSLAKVLEQLNSNLWKENLQNKVVNAKKVDVLMPRFKTETTQVLNEVLQQQGMRSMFQPMGEMDMLSTDNSDLKVDMVKHKAIFEVTEEGSEASAATVIRVMMANEPKEDKQKLEFHANRPFIYLVQEDTSGAIFFMGQFWGESYISE